MRISSFGQCGEAPAAINDRLNTALLKAFPEHNEAGKRSGSSGSRASTAPPRASGSMRSIWCSAISATKARCASYAKGWQLNELQLLLGHSNLVQTSTYLGIGNEAVMDAMARHGSGAKVIAPNVEGNPQGQSEAIRGGKPGPKRGSRYQVTH